MHKNTLKATALVILVLSNIGAQAGYRVPTDGLIGYWSGNGNAIDLSSVGNSGTFAGSYSAGAPTGGKAFNLATAKVTIANSAAYNFKSYSGWSVGFWFNDSGTAISASNGLFLGQDSGSGFKPKWFIDYSYSVYGNNSDFNFHVNDFNQERIFIGSDSVIPPTGWNQLTVTINNINSGLVAFYLNGRALGTGSLGNYVLSTTAPLVFGQAEGLSFNGSMSQVVIYGRVLSTNEISQLASVAIDNPFAIIGEALDGTGNVIITWESIPGRTYQVVTANSLNPPISWTNLGMPVLATNNNTSAAIPLTTSASFVSVISP